MINPISIIQSVGAAYKAYQVILSAAHEVGDAMHAQGQPELKQKLADLEAQNEADRARRHAKLVEAAKQ